MIEFGSLITDPFPHSATPRCLKRGDFRWLRRQFPSKEFFLETTNPNRVMVEQADKPWLEFMRTSPAWQHFYQYISSVEFYEKSLAHLSPSFAEFGFKGVSINEVSRPDLYFFLGGEGYGCPIHMDSGDRIFSMMIYFDDCEGGDLILYDKEGVPARMVNPQSNTMALWASCQDSFHGVLPVTKGIRRSAYVSLRGRGVVWKGQAVTQN
jgi:hypothetical protein